MIEPIRLVFGEELAARIEIFLKTLFKRYFLWIEAHPLTGVSISQSNTIFDDTQFFSNLFIFTFLEQDKHKIKLCLPEGTKLLLNEKSSSDDLIALMEVKEAKDRIRLWVKGKENPSLKYISEIEQFAPSSELTAEEWINVKWGIIASRFVRMHQTPDNNVFFSYEAYRILTQNTSQVFKRAYSKNSQDFQHVNHIADMITHEHSRSDDGGKTDEDKTKIEHLLVHLKNEIIKIDQFKGLGFIYHQLNAHHLVLIGNLSEAKKEYVKAFEGAIYNAHAKNQIQSIIKESLRVAAFQSRPDKVFITRLKSFAILIGIDQYPAKTEDEKVQKTLVLNNNEIEAYKTEFIKMFPIALSYPNVSYPVFDQKAGILILDRTDNIGKEKNKNIKVGVAGGLQRKTTPLIEAVKNNDIDAVKRLLDAGASVNVISEVGDSPLLMSLTSLNYLDLFTSNDDSIFQLLVKHSHNADILNTVTTRHMNFPLYAAIETGRAGIVKTVLSLNEDIQIDQRGGLDYGSSLYNILLLISLVKDPNRLGEILDQNTNAETMHRLKPMFAGISSIDNSNIEKMMLDKDYIKVSNAIKTKLLENQKERTPSISALRQIARILIKNGADVNLIHKIKGMNYTPLMLAAEKDEIQLFKIMIKYGGFWEKTYTLPPGAIYDKKAINCQDIAHYYKSYDVFNYISESLMETS